MLKNEKLAETYVNSCIIYLRKLLGLILKLFFTERGMVTFILFFFQDKFVSIEQCKINIYSFDIKIKTDIF